MYLHVIWLNTANKKGVASEMFVTDQVIDLFFNFLFKCTTKGVVDLKMTFLI